MADPYDGVGTSPYGATMTPEQYYGAVKGMYPNAVFDSGGRTPEHNAEVGGVPNSMHVTNQALDFRVPGVPSNQVFSNLRQQGLPETEALDEGDHLHVGWRPKGNMPAADPYAGLGAAPGGDPYASVGAAPAAQPVAPAPAPRAAGATGLGMLGETYEDLTNPNHPNHDPNALESGIIGATYSKPVQSVQANYQQAVNTGLFMEPVRASMEALGVGRQPGETNDSLHNRYNQAITSARQQAQQKMQDNTVGSYDTNNPVDALTRFGQQATNVGAGIVANPQYFLLPGMGVGGSVAARVATAGLGNAAVGGASDAAAQIMDMAEGQKKDFDVEQSLKSAVVGGVFGAALHGAAEGGPIVSDYVKGLFANRGMDTTPAANPGGTIQPMTTDHVAMNASDHMRYQHLLQTGSVDDIKQFFQGRQGPQPSWQDVNTWVEHRDNPPAATNGVSGPDPSRMPDFNYADEYNAHAEDTYRETQRQAVEDHVNQQMAGWTNAPKVNVVHGPEDIADPAVRDSVLKADPQGNALGLYGADGQVHMFSGRITDPSVANAVLFHEGLGHYGLSQLFGDKLNQTLVSMADSNVGQFGKLVEARQAANPGESRALSAEEVLAEKSQDGQIKPSWQLALNSVVRRFGRRMGMKLDMNDAEVQHVLSMAHDAVVNGKTVPENGFKGATQDPNNKFMKAPHELTNPDDLGVIDRLKADPRYWSDPEFRANVAEMARIQDTKALNEESNTQPDNKFITRAQLNRSRATKPNYEMDDLAGVAAHVEANYTPNVMSREEVRAAAIENGINPDQLRGRDLGELSTQVSKIGYAARYAAIKVGGILNRLDTPDWRPDDHVKLAEAIAQRNALIEMFKGEGNELGRAMATLKVFKELTNGHLSELMDTLRSQGSGLAELADPTNPEALKFARQLKQALQSNSNPKAANTLMQGVTKPYWEQYLTTFHMNAMLSALSTHVKAPVDMATGITREVLEKALSIPASKARQMYQAMTGKVVEPGVEVAELFNHIHGIMAAVTDMEVYRAVAHALRTGESSFVSNGQRTPTQFANQYGAISSPRLGNTTSAAGKVVGLLNKPTDLISAQDTVFRSVATNAHLLSLATREARIQMPQGTTSDIMSLGRQIARNPNPSMLREAFKEANKTLLLNDNPVNNLINKARVYKPNMNAFERGLNFFVTNLAPFIRVESNNLLNRVVQRSPLGLYQLMDPRSDLRAGGAKADIAMTRILYGSVLMGMYWMAAGQKNSPLTGAGPDNVDKYKEKIASGWRPDAVQENGGFNTGGQLGMSVNPWDMHNKTAQLVASARQAYDAGMSAQGWGSALKMASGSILSNLAGMSWVSDIQPAVDAARAHGQEGQNVVSSFASHEAATWVPNGVNQVSRLMDPVQRDTSAPGSISGAVGNEMLNETPGRTSLPIKYSVYGDPLANGASLTGVHTIIPGLSGNGTTETQDPAERELDRLSSMSNKAIVTPVTHTISVDPTDSSQGKIALKPAQIEEYQRLAGKSIVAYVQQDLDSGSWASMSDEQRVEEVHSIEADSKRAAADAIREQIR